MAYLLEPYDSALQEILDRGIEKKDRTGVGTISVAGLQRKYALDHVMAGSNDSQYQCVFPIVTGRKLFPKSVFAELLWFISGSTQNEDLVKLGAKFWGLWCDENNPKYVEFRTKWGLLPGDFGAIYGWQLRHFGADYVGYRRIQKNRDEDIARAENKIAEATDDIRKGFARRRLESARQMWLYFEEEHLAQGFDQLDFMVNILKNDPYGSDGRRCLFSLWNPPDLKKMALPPCHYTYQAIADGDGGLTGILTQRSCDFPVGVPANIQFYSTLTIMLAQQANLKPREFIHNTNDSHVYLNQVAQVKEYLSREKPDSPTLTVKKASDIYSYTMDDFEVTNYNPLDRIDVPVAV